MSETNLSNDFLKVITFSEKLDYASKKAHNFKWAKLRADALDVLHPDAPDPEYLDRVLDNYRLMNGMSMINFTKNARKEAAINMQDLVSEGIDMPDLELEHFDILSPMIEGHIGDQQRRKFRFVVTDNSMYTRNYLKDQRNTLYTNHFQEELIIPMRQKALISYQLEHGIKDIFSLSDEERKQMESDIASRVDTLIPKDIMLFMKYGSAGKLEKQGQAIAEALAHQMQLKYLGDLAYADSYATDGIVFHMGIRREKPVIDLVDLTKFNTGGSPSAFVNNNAWFKWVEGIHPSDVWNNYSEDWTREDIRRFNEMVSMGGRSRGVDEQKDAKFVANITFDGQVRLGQTDLKTKQGQVEYSKLLHEFQGSDYKGMEDIRVAHLVWSSLRKMRCITRGYNDGTIRYEWFDEAYEFNPNNGDLKEEVRWVREYWETDKIGQGADPIFCNMRPVQCQFRDITDPYQSRSPFVGGYLHDMLGKGYRRSEIDRVKPFIHEINFQMKTIREREATDIGKVVLMTVAAKPQGWSWGKLISVVRATKLLPIRTGQQGLTALDVNFFKEIDLSNLYDILPRINYLQWMISKVAEGIGNNAARQGNPAASTSVSNNMTNLNRSFSQTHNRSQWFDKIMEMAVENLIYLGQETVREGGNIFLRNALDDFSIETIDIDFEAIDQAYFGVKVISDESELEKLDIGKNFLVPFLQKNNLAYRFAAQTLNAATQGELLEIANEAELEAEINQAKAVDFQKMQAAEQAQYEKDILVLKSELKKVEDALNNEAKKEMAALQSMTIAHGNDVNDNKVNDYSETADKNRVADLQKALITDSLEREKLALKDKWTTEQLSILNKEVDKMTASGK